MKVLLSHDISTMRRIWGVVLRDYIPVPIQNLITHERRVYGGREPVYEYTLVLDESDVLLTWSGAPDGCPLPWRTVEAVSGALSVLPEVAEEIMRIYNVPVLHDEDGAEYQTISIPKPFERLSGQVMVKETIYGTVRIDNGIVSIDGCPELFVRMYMDNQYEYILQIKK
ncbi:MAG: hypothetical protein QXX77_08035 [Candidatus Methanosuratincola sp.]